MAKVILGNHTAVFAARSEQDRIRKFYCDILGCKIRVQNDEVDRFQLDDLHICFVWQSTSPDESHFLKATYLELKTDNTEDMEQKILAFGIKKLNVPDAHLYFQAPGGQVFRLVGIDEDLSHYEGSPSSKPGSSAAATQRDYQAMISANIRAEEAIDRISRVPDWWTKGFTGASQKPGDTFIVRWGETFVEFRVTDVIPEKKIVWQVTNCNLPWQADKTEWKNTKVRWEISAKDGSTTVRMTHVGLVQETECYENCEKGWNFYVKESLHRLLTEGKGLPDVQKARHAQPDREA